MDDPLPPLSLVEARVLGSLIEKQIATPDYYPLSLNALVNACNQLTNREPVMALDEPTVVRALDGLREKRLATLFTGADARVAKYKHTLGDRLLLTPAEVALLCVLLLRGPQTVGELRTRSERLYAFESLAEAEEALRGLAERTPAPLVARLPRAPGTKEARFAHLFAGPVDTAVPFRSLAPEPATALVRAENERAVRLEQDVADLRRELLELRQQFADFRRQFD
jgi:hypothetical protein